MEFKFRAVSLINDEVRDDVTAVDFEKRTVSFGSVRPTDLKDYREVWFDDLRLDLYTGVKDSHGKEIYSGDFVKAEFVHPVAKDYFIGKVVLLEGKWLIDNEKECMAIELWSESNVLTILEGDELEEFLVESDN